MKTTKKQVRVPKTPKGWRKLRRGETVRKGDKYFRPDKDRFLLPPKYVSFIGDRIGQNWGDLSTQPWVRRLPARRGKGRK